MARKKRAAPTGEPERPIKTDALLPLNAPYPGCCTPYPDARFKDQLMVELYDHHRGPNCKGFMEERSVEEWYAQIDADRRLDGGDE